MIAEHWRLWGSNKLTMLWNQRCWSCMPALRPCLFQLTAPLVLKPNGNGVACASSSAMARPLRVSRFIVLIHVKFGGSMERTCPSARLGQQGCVINSQPKSCLTVLLLQFWLSNTTLLSTHVRRSFCLSATHSAAKQIHDKGPELLENLSLSTVCLGSLLWNPSKAGRWLPPVVRLKETSASSMYRSAWSAGAATGEVVSAANWVVAMTEAATPRTRLGGTLRFPLSLTKIQSPSPSLFVTWVRCF